MRSKDFLAPHPDRTPHRTLSDIATSVRPHESAETGRRPRGHTRALQSQAERHQPDHNHTAARQPQWRCKLLQPGYAKLLGNCGLFSVSRPPPVSVTVCLPSKAHESVFCVTKREAFLTCAEWGEAHLQSSSCLRCLPPSVKGISRTFFELFLTLFNHCIARRLLCSWSPPYFLAC